MGEMLTPPSALEALLFAANGPLAKRKAAALLGVSGEELAIAARALDSSLAGRGIALLMTDTELELRAAGEASAIVEAYRESELSRDLGKASLETLAIIAYQKGATRGDIDWVRGVHSSASLRTLLMRGLVEGTEDPRDKRRIRYTLTTEALAHLGATSPENLPEYEQLSAETAAALTEAEQ
jgi:segregation and condensation protein B